MYTYVKYIIWKIKLHLVYLIFDNIKSLVFHFQSCQTDLVKDNGHKYFLSVLADPYMPVSVDNETEPKIP